MSTNTITVNELSKITSGYATDLLLATRGTTGHKMNFGDFAKYVTETYQAAVAGQNQSIIDALNEVHTAIGGPQVAATAAAMTDQSKIYVYTGSETGYTAGNWYYYNGSAWTSGGVYNAVAVQTDPSLSEEGVAADAKATGDAIDAATVAIDDTLTQTGEAADAKKTGDEISELKNALNEKASAVIDDTALSFTHNNLSFSDNIRFIGNSYAFGSAKYANRPNLFPDLYGSDFTKNGVNIGKHGKFLTYTGTCTGSGTSTLFNRNATGVGPGNYKLLFQATKGNSGVYQGNYNFTIKIDGVTYQTGITIDDSVAYVYDVIVTNANPVINLIIDVKQDITYEGFTLWYALYKSDVVITDTNHVVAPSETYNYAVNSTSGIVDTMQHESIISTVIDTKEYIDNHIPDDVVTESDLIYITPEMYGAVGDGISDDYEAIQDCIDASASETPPKPIRGFGNYKISTGLSIIGRNIDLYINKISYTGNSAAIVISTYFSTIRFNQIIATAGGSNACGIRCYAGVINGNTVPCAYSNISCVDLRSNGNTVELIRESGNILYNVFHFLYQNSANSNIIYVSGTEAIAELDIYGKGCSANNGYLLYTSPNTLLSRTRLHQYSIEGNMKNGVYGGAILVDCRNEECMDKNKELTDPNNNIGYMFDLTGTYPNDSVASDGKYKSQGQIDYISVKTDGALSYDDVVNLVKENLENQVLNPTYPLLKARIGDFGFCNRYAPYDDTYGSHLLHPGKLYVYYNHKAYVPNDEWYLKISEATFHTLSNNYVYSTPTVFDIDASIVTIYLDYSYCCKGINRFEVIQYNDKKAVVYDKEGNLLFNGAQEDGGCYIFECLFENLEELDITLSDQSVVRIQGVNIRGIYTGTNERWLIKKSNILL